MNRILQLEDPVLALNAAKAFVETLDAMLQSGDAARHDVSKLNELNGRPLAVITARTGVSTNYELVAGECNYVARAQPLGGIERNILYFARAYGIMFEPSQQPRGSVLPNEPLASVKAGLKGGEVASGSLWYQSHLSTIGPDQELRGSGRYEHWEAAKGQKEVALYTLAPKALEKMQMELEKAGMSLLK